MQRIKMNGFARFLVLVAMAMFLLPLGPGISLADKAPAIKMKHEPIKYYVPEKRIRLEAKVKSEDKVDIVRCYFKGETHADYVFVPMTPLKEGLYSAILPAPSADSKGITYLFLVVTDKNDVVRTQEYNIEKSDDDKTPAWQAIDGGGNIHVSTELAEAPEMLAGFTDSIVVDVVESAARFGFVTYGIYTASQIAAAGGTTGSAATATEAGVVTATAGMSTAAIVGIGVGAAVVIGGGAAAGIAIANKDDEDDEDEVPINTSAGVKWGDYGSQATHADDAFELWFAGRFIGTSPTGSVGEATVSGLEVGTHELQIRFVTPNAGLGSFAIDLSGGASFSSGGTHREGLLNLNETRTFTVNVPAP